jgi:hypothetical protein
MILRWRPGQIARIGRSNVCRQNSTLVLASVSGRGQQKSTGLADRIIECMFVWAEIGLANSDRVDNENRIQNRKRMKRIQRKKNADTPRVNKGLVAFTALVRNPGASLSCDLSFALFFRAPLHQFIFTRQFNRADGLLTLLTRHHLCSARRERHMFVLFADKSDHFDDVR